MYIASTKTWYLERFIRLFAGILVLGSTFLGFFVHPDWFLLTGFVGVMLTIFALTGFCPMSIILYALGVRERCRC
jgi:Inner membrane protein YgaP-like, transmembrane domain